MSMIQNFRKFSLRLLKNTLNKILSFRLIMNLMSFWDKDLADFKVEVILFDGTGGKSVVRAGFCKKQKHLN